MLDVASSIIQMVRIHVYFQLFSQQKMKECWQETTRIRIR
eukprot:UN10287